MKNKTLLLLKAQLVNQFNPKQIRENKVFLISNGILLVMIATYSCLLAFGFGVMNSASAIPAYALTLGGLISFFFTMFKTNSVIFANGDYDRLFSLPISEKELIASRFLSMYIINTIFLASVMVPMMVVYYLFGSFTWYNLLTWILGLILGTLIPTVIATTIGALIAFVSSKFKKTKIVSTILSLGLLIAVLAGSIGMSGLDKSQVGGKKLLELGKTIEHKIYQIYPVSRWFSDAFQGNIIDVILFAFVSIGAFLLFVWLLSIRYQKIHSALSANYVKSNYKMHQLQCESPARTIFRKECKRFFGSNIYLTNSGLGALLAIVFSIACCFMGVDKIVKDMQIPYMQESIGRALPFITASILGMCCTTACSISLEGKNAWILQSSPVKTIDIVRGKIELNLVITIPSAVICGIALTIAWHKSPLEIVSYFLVPIVFTTFCSVMGLVMNYKFPKMEWENEVQVVKQSTSTLLGVFGSLLIGVVAFIFIMLTAGLPYLLILSSVIVFWIVVTILLYRYLITRKKLF